MSDSDEQEHESGDLTPPADPPSDPPADPPTDPPADDEWPDEDDGFPSQGDSSARGAELDAMLLGTTMPDDPEPGAVAKGTIIQIGHEEIFVDIGAKSEAQISRLELSDDDGNLTVAVGDPIEASVVSVKDGIRLSYRMLKSAKSKEALDDAYAARLPVEGRVTSTRKGGFEIALPGNQAGFCPLSQIDDRRVEDPEVWVGRSLEFLVTEISGGKRRNIVVSRRKMLDRDSEQKAAELKQTLTEGMVLTGRVVSLQNFGAFVDLGGVQGLVHISEISRSRVGHPSDVVTVDEEVQVKVVKFDRETGKIGLSMKELTEDPWATIEGRASVGQAFDGTVTRVAEFGAFVEIIPGVDGLLHVSELAQGRGSKSRDAKTLVKPGEKVRVKVMAIDAAQRRVSLGFLDPDGVDNSAELAVGAILEGKVTKVETFGVFVRLGPGATGLVPNEEMGTNRGTDHTKDFPPGTAIKVEVLEIEDGGRRIRLSLSSVAARAEREEVSRYLQSDESAGSSTGLSIMGDALKGFKK